MQAMPVEIPLPLCYDQVVIWTKSEESMLILKCQYAKISENEIAIFDKTIQIITPLGCNKKHFFFSKNGYL